LSLAASQGFGQSFGGNITATYGFGSLTETLGGLDSIEGDSYTGFGVQGSVGFALSSNISAQLDAGWMSTGNATDDYFNATAYNIHVFMPAGAMQVGGFYGFGTGNHVDDSDEGNVSYFGIDAALPMNNGQLAAQIGLGTHTNSHDSLDYENAFFGTVEYRHFVNDDLMLRGSAGMANFVTHGDPGTVYLLQADATYRISGNLSATAGVRDFVMINDGEGSGYDLQAFVGLQMTFGAGGSLQDSMAATPMIATMLPSLTAIASSIVD